ncbi:Protein-tyrosine-phosphatase IBR5-like protein [Drosera capensis]
MSARKRDRDNPCDVCGHYHNRTAGDICGECGHRVPGIGDEAAAGAGSVSSAFPSEILPEFLYLVEDYWDFQDPQFPSCNNLYKNSFDYHSLQDNKDLNFDDAVQFLRKAEREKARVLVHCMSGKNRSPAIVIAYLMKSRKWKLAESLQWVKERRPAVQLSPGIRADVIRSSLMSTKTPSVSPVQSTQSFGYDFPKKDEVPVRNFNANSDPSIFDRPLFNPRDFAFGVDHSVVKNADDV